MMYDGGHSTVQARLGAYYLTLAKANIKRTDAYLAKSRSRDDEQAAERLDAVAAEHREWLTANGVEFDQ